MTTDNNLQCIMREDLTDLKIAVQGSEKDIGFIKDELKKSAKTNQNEHTKIEDTLKDYLDKINKDCAGKWVENAMKWLAFAVIGAVVTAIVKLVIN